MMKAPRDRARVFLSLHHPHDGSTKPHMEEKPKPLKASRSATEAGHSASASASTCDMKPCDSKLWLMKVPNFLLEHWTTRNEGRPTEVGTVKETVGADGTKSMTLQLSDQGDYPKEWPREYHFEVAAPPTSMHVFSTGAKGTMQIDGRVEKRVPAVPTRRPFGHPSAARSTHARTHTAPGRLPGRGETAGAEQAVPRDHEAARGAGPGAARRADLPRGRSRHGHGPAHGAPCVPWLYSLRRDLF